MPVSSVYSVFLHGDGGGVPLELYLATEAGWGTSGPVRYSGFIRGLIQTVRFWGNGRYPMLLGLREAYRRVTRVTWRMSRFMSSGLLFRIITTTQWRWRKKDIVWFVLNYSFKWLSKHVRRRGSTLFHRYMYTFDVLAILFTVNLCFFAWRCKTCFYKTGRDFPEFF